MTGSLVWCGVSPGPVSPLAASLSHKYTGTVTPSQFFSASRHRRTSVQETSMLGHLIKLKFPGCHWHLPDECWHFSWNKTTSVGNFQSKPGDKRKNALSPVYCFHWILRLQQLVSIYLAWSRLAWNFFLYKYKYPILFFYDLYKFTFNLQATKKL